MTRSQEFKVVWFVVLVFAVFILAGLMSYPRADAHPTPGRTVWLGDWAGVVRCESGGGRLAHNPSSADSYFQFLTSTWSDHARDLGKRKLAGTAPHDVNIARQMVMAQTLANRYGIGSQWVCSHAYGTGSGYVALTDPLPIHRPRGCTRHLLRHEIPERVARSLCGTT